MSRDVAERRRRISPLMKDIHAKARPLLEAVRKIKFLLFLESFLIFGRKESVDELFGKFRRDERLLQKRDEASVHAERRIPPNRDVEVRGVFLESRL